MADHEDQSGFFRKVLKLFRFGDVGGDGFFDQDMLSRLQHRLGYWIVSLGRRHDDDEIHFRVL